MVGIVIKGGFRNIGIGTGMTLVLAEVTRKMVLEALTLSALQATAAPYPFTRRLGLCRLA